MLPYTVVRHSSLPKTHLERSFELRRDRGDAQLASTRDSPLTVWQDRLGASIGISNCNTLCIHSPSSVLQSASSWPA